MQSEFYFYLLPGLVGVIGGIHIFSLLNAIKQRSTDKKKASNIIKNMLTQPQSSTAHKTRLKTVCSDEKLVDSLFTWRVVYVIMAVTPILVLIVRDAIVD